MFNTKNNKRVGTYIYGTFRIIGTYEVCKVSLFCFDDKRQILDDGINSSSYFKKDMLKE